MQCVLQLQWEQKQNQEQKDKRNIFQYLETEQHPSK